MLVGCVEQAAPSTMASSEDHASNNSSDDLLLSTFVKRRRTLSDSEDSDTITADIEAETENNTEEKEQEINWRIAQGDQVNSAVGFSDSDILSYTEPHSFYSLFATDEIFQLIADQTNIYAAQVKSEQWSQRLDKWLDTNAEELKRFFGLIIWMGLVRLPEIHLYWSTDEGYNLTFPRTVMSRNRFELLLRLIHFSNDAEHTRECQLDQIIDMLNGNFRKYHRVDEVLCVDDSFMPFRGRIKVRQYLKRARSGLKVFKLCDSAGYVYSFQIYTSEDHTDDVSGYKASQSVRLLCKEILRNIISTDNWCTSSDIAEKLVAIHRQLPGKSQDVMKHEHVVIKSKNSVETTSVDETFYQMPTIAVEYNVAKSNLIDLSDQMTTYSSPLRRTVTWYKHLALELLLNTCIVNALLLFRQITRRNIKVPEFRMKLAVHLTKSGDSEHEQCLASRRSLLPQKVRHEIKKMPGKASSTRRFCKICYEKNSKNLGRTLAKNCTNKVVTYCGDCTGSPFLCLPCFNKIHRSMRA